MIKNLFGIFDTVLYVQIWENRIMVTDIHSGEFFDETPLLAIERNKKGQRIVSAVGNDVKMLHIDENIEVINPFSHPRGLLNDFFAAEKVLQHIFHVLFNKRFVSVSPRVVVHPMEKNEGGITMIEAKAFTEMALGAGAREAIVHQGSILSPLPFDFEKIKKDNQEILPSHIELKPKKENYFALVFSIAAIGGLFWFLYFS
jgi:rod shape-determining protein MreB